MMRGDDAMRCGMRVGLAMWGVMLCGVAAGFAAEPAVDFDHDIVPVLKQHCASCHAGAKKQGGFSLNTRELLLAGGESGKVVIAGKSGMSELVKRITSDDPNLRMPPEGPRVPAAAIKKISQWIDGGLNWTAGFSFQPGGYEPPLKPRRPVLPPAVTGREHPIDRFIDAYLAERKAPLPSNIDDAQFARRASLDLTGLLPEPDRLASYLGNSQPDKRARFVDELLADDVAYAEHWLTFWNDLLRNDYSGTGFITGGRKQISRWLYQALVTNKPYDQFVRELIAPVSDESRGFSDGIRWRGEVSAGQTVEIQFAQSVGQSFLGINLKCASCHDSFIDRWKLTDAYGLAAIYSDKPLQIHRCDKPIGQTAKPAWLFPELGEIDPRAKPADRLRELARLLTSAENGRFARTIVNRLWHRLMGRGIVHPTDAMQTEPWHAGLLDFLAADFVEHGHNLKHTLALIATSQAYQSRAQVVTRGTDDAGYVYAGPRAKRLSAEQFVDAVWQLTDAAPKRYDAPIARGKPTSADTKSPGTAPPAPFVAPNWLWSQADSSQAPARETVVFRKQFTLKAVPTVAVALVSCDNSYSLYLNQQAVHQSDNWEQIEPVVLTPRLKVGRNDLVIVARNGGNGPNPAGLLFMARFIEGDKTVFELSGDDTWEWTRKLPDARGRFAKDPEDWSKAAVVTNARVWNERLGPQLAAGFDAALRASKRMVRASLMKNDFLMRSLGRPHREQIVSVRPEELSMLEAVDLSNGQILSNMLAVGGKSLSKQHGSSTGERIDWLFRFALSRPPTPAEREELLAELGENPSEVALQDLLWSVLMLPEFQLVR